MSTGTNMQKTTATELPPCAAARHIGTFTDDNGNMHIILYDVNNRAIAMAGFTFEDALKFSETIVEALDYVHNNHIAPAV